jgi:hypothetical protein
MRARVVQVHVGLHDAFEVDLGGVEVVPLRQRVSSPSKPTRRMESWEAMHASMPALLRTGPCGPAM